MKYLTLSADYISFSLKDDYSDSDLSQNLDLHLLDLLNGWNDEYKKIIPLSSKERVPLSKKIMELDHTGLILAQKIKDSLDSEEKIKIKYFSEGNLMYLEN